ncbi:MAG TPA: DUF2227 family putative metal-binding protein [Abditibacteriaceae bacterium]|jgi:uncharacterized metal-binding protein
MPSGKVHAQCSLVLAVPAFGFVAGATGDNIAAGTCALGCLLGIMLTPDLDQEGLSSSENALVKYTLGLGFLWAMLWYPYARLIKHRSPLSHFPLIGTAGRLLYLGLLLLIPSYWGWHLIQPPPETLRLLLFALGGLILSDTGHWILDTKFGDKPKRRRA